MSILDGGGCVEQFLRLTPASDISVPNTKVSYPATQFDSSQKPIMAFGTVPKAV
jgi:hypothetical protein